MKKWTKIIIVAVLIIGLGSGSLYLLSVRNYQESVKAIQVQPIDLQSMTDGEYVGECNVGFIYAQVKVIIESHQIKSIELLEHKNEKGKAAEQIVDKIISEQTINVDTVSGATNSSKVIQKAVEQALCK